MPELCLKSDVKITHRHYEEHVLPEAQTKTFASNKA
jgi:hypothetical protein